MAGIDFLGATADALGVQQDLNGLPKIDFLGGIAKGLDNKLLRRSGRELAQEQVQAAISKPVMTDNWDIVMEYSPITLQNLLTTYANTIKNLAVGTVSAVAGTAQFLASGKYNQGFINAKASSESFTTMTENFQSLVKNITVLTENFTNKLALTKLSVRTTSISLPTYEVKHEFIKFGPLRFNYPIDFNFGEGFTMTVLEDEAMPLYPVFESLKNLQFGLNGTVNEASIGKVDMYLCLYSDYTGFPYITYYLSGCRIKSIDFGSGGKTSFSRGKEGVEPLSYTIQFALDDFKVQFNKINPIISFGAKALNLNSSNLSFFGQGFSRGVIGSQLV